MLDSHYKSLYFFFQVPSRRSGPWVLGGVGGQALHVWGICGEAYRRPGSATINNTEEAVSSTRKPLLLRQTGRLTTMDSANTNISDPVQLTVAKR